MTLLRLAIMFLSAFLLLACADSSDGDSCSVGSEGCSCTTGGGCDPGLDCRSMMCVCLDDEGCGSGSQSDSSAIQNGGADADSDSPTDEGEDAGVCLDEEDCGNSDPQSGLSATDDSGVDDGEDAAECIDGCCGLVTPAGLCLRTDESQCLEDEVFRNITGYGYCAESCEQQQFDDVDEEDWAWAATADDTCPAGSGCNERGICVPTCSVIAEVYDCTEGFSLEAMEACKSNGDFYTAMDSVVRHPLEYYFDDEREFCCYRYGSEDIDIECPEDYFCKIATFGYYYQVRYEGKLTDTTMGITSRCVSDSSAVISPPPPSSPNCGLMSEACQECLGSPGPGQKMTGECPACTCS